MANNRDSFLYDATLNSKQIRLLYIEYQGSSSCDALFLRVELVEGNLDTADFDALSYVWGDRATRISISCNVKSHTIGHSLQAELVECQPSMAEVYGHMQSASTRATRWRRPANPADERHLQCQP